MSKFFGKLGEMIFGADEELEEFEVIKQYTILSERFTEQNGMLTPTQKTKKRVVLEVYAKEIEAMYSKKA